MGCGLISLYCLGVSTPATINDKIKEKTNYKLKSRYNNYSGYNSDFKNPTINAPSNNSIYWIENLLKIPISDGRKTSICLILSPYLMNIRRLSYDRSHSIIIDWLNKCSLLHRLRFNPNSFTKSALLYAVNNGYKPLKFDNLKERNRELYYQIKNKT